MIKKAIVDQPNIEIVLLDFGGIEGVRGIGGKIFGKIIQPYYEPIIQGLLKHNFSVVFASPSFSGSGKSIVVFYQRRLPSIFMHIKI